MVAEFRRAKPNLVYVNLSDSNTSQGSNAESPEVSQPHRPIVKENIIRRGDNLLVKLLDADPELRPVIMGTSNPNQPELAPYSHVGDYSYGENFSEHRSNDNLNFGTEVSLAAGRSSADSTHAGGGHRTSANTSATEHGRQSDGSTSHTSAPLIRLADFSNVSSFGRNDRSSVENSDLPRYSFSDPIRSNSSYGDYNSGSVPRVTIIRSTSTYEVQTIPATASFNNNAHGFSVDGAHAAANFGRGVGSQGSHSNGAAPHVNYADSVAGWCETAASSHGRRPGGSVGPVRPRYSSNDVLCTDPQCKATKYLMNQESLLKENQVLKRKCQILAGTIGDQEKLQKVLRCLADRKRAAAAAAAASVAAACP